MQQFFTAEQAAQLASQTVRCDFLVKFDFVGQTVCVWNGEYELTAGGQVWTPMHGIAKIDGFGLSNGTRSEAVSFTISGVPNQEPNLLQLALQETPRTTQRLVTIYMQLFDDNWQPVGVPIGVWFGFLQPPRVERSQMDADSGPIQVISVSAENAFYNRARPAYGRCTDRDQQKRFPGDKFFQFVDSLKNKTIVYPDYED